MLSRPQRRESDDAGMTLIELVVGMTLMVIVSAVALNFFVGTTTQANLVSEQSLVGASAREAMTQIAKTLQVADSPTTPGSADGRFTTYTATEVAFYSDFASASRSGTAQPATPSLVDLKLSGGTLSETITPPGTNAVPSTNTLVTGVTNGTVFTYCSDATDPSNSCTTTTNPDSIAMVQVSITVQGLKGTSSQTVQSGIAIDGALS